MPFAKGNTPWIKGRKVSEEVRGKISASLKKNKYKRHTVAGWNKGIPITGSQKEKLRQSRLGKTSWNKGVPMREDTKIKLSAIRRRQGVPWLVGKTFTDEHRSNISSAKEGKPVPWRRGSKSNFYKDGLSGIRRDARSVAYDSPKYKRWRRAVFRRDAFTCVLCGKQGYINADHIQPWALYPELRFDVNNGRTLCVGCHRKTDTYGRKTRKDK